MNGLNRTSQQKNAFEGVGEILQLGQLRRRARDVIKPERVALRTVITGRVNALAVASRLSCDNAARAILKLLKRRESSRAIFLAGEFEFPQTQCVLRRTRPALQVFLMRRAGDSDAAQTLRAVSFIHPNWSSCIDK